MYLDTSNSTAFRAPAKAGLARSATVEHNPLSPRMPWALRRYGKGRCTIARGVPKHYATETRADQVAATWIATGVSPADQGAA